MGLFFYISGPRVPRNFVQESPSKDLTLKTEEHLYIPEYDVSDSASEDCDTTVTYAQKVITKQRKFKFRRFDNEATGKHPSPTSSPLKWPDSPIIISSDEELEKSMLAMDY